MKHFISSQIGRTFIIRMERGDYLKESIIDLVNKEDVKNAIISSGIATFDEANFQMAITYDFPIKYHVEHLKEPLELVSLDGTIINYEPHIHCVISNESKTWAGHLLDGCRILYLGEIVIQELLGVKLERREDKDGVRIIYEME